MSPIRRARAQKQEAAAQTCLDALRLLSLTRAAPAPADELALHGKGPAGDATTPPPPPSPSPPPLPPQPQTMPEPESQPQEAGVEAEPGTSKQHSSPPQPEEPSRVERNIRGVLKAMLDMGAFPDERYALYLGDFFKAYLQAPRPIDPPPLPDAAGTAGLEPIQERYPYLADEVARIKKAAEQREVLSRGLLRAEAATLAALEAEFSEATLAGKEAMQAKLEAEVQYAKARVDTEAMIEMVSDGKVG